MVYTWHTDKNAANGWANGLHECISRGGLRKVADVAPPCQHREHNPPTHISLHPGVYEHACPGCGHVTRFTVAM